MTSMKILTHETLIQKGEDSRGVEPLCQSGAHVAPERRVSWSVGDG